MADEDNKQTLNLEQDCEQPEEENENVDVNDNTHDTFNNNNYKNYLSPHVSRLYMSSSFSSSQNDSKSRDRGNDVTYWSPDTVGENGGTEASFGQVGDMVPAHRLRLGSDNSFQFRQRLGSDSSYQNQYNPGSALHTIGERSSANSARNRMDSTGSGYSIGSNTSPRNRFGHNAFYDSDASNGSLIFQKPGGSLAGSVVHSRHWRQPSDTSVLSFDSANDPYLFGDAPQHSTSNNMFGETGQDNYNQYPNVLHSSVNKHTSQVPKKLEVNRLDQSHLPYHQRKMLRANAEDDSFLLDLEDDRNQFGSDTNRKSPTKFNKVEKSDKKSTPSINKENKEQSAKLSQKSHRSKNKSPQKSNRVSKQKSANNTNNQSSSQGATTSAQFRSKRPPQLNTISPLIHDNENPLSNTSFPGHGQSVGMSSMSPRLNYPLPRGSNYGNRVRTASSDSISPDKENVGKKSISNNTKLSRPPRMEGRSSSTGSTKSTLTINGRPRFDSQDSFRSSSSSNGVKGGGNSAVLSTLSDQLAKDVAHFFRGEKKRKGGNEQQSGHRKGMSSSGSGLFNIFPQLSPQKDMPKEKPSIEDEKREYHLRNQEFLNKAKVIAQQNNAFVGRASSPINGYNRYSHSSISPSFGVKSHRPLKSIDNDNWDDDEDGEEFPSKRTQTYNKLLNHERNEWNRHDEDEKSKPTNEIINNTSTNPEKDDDIEDSGKESEYVNSEEEYTNNDSQDLTFSSDNDFSSNLGTSISSTGSSDLHYKSPSERSSLLPPPGISSHEPYGTGRRRSPAREKERFAKKDRRRFRKEREQDERERRYRELKWLRAEDRKMRSKDKKDKRRKKERAQSRKSQSRNGKEKRDLDDYIDDLSSSSESLSSGHYRRKDRSYDARSVHMLRKERERLIAIWKEEHKREMEALRKFEEENRWYNRFYAWSQNIFSTFTTKLNKVSSTAETFISNLPLTVGAIALAIGTLGVVWFKFAEENLDSCVPVHYHAAQCTFPEFPGCFYCDETVKWYQYAVRFHYYCSVIAGSLAFCFILKVIVAFRVVTDEMSLPTTSSPAGLICMTLVLVGAGQGIIGQFVVTLASAVHLCIACWFIYMALAYHILPDPSWFPNTVGIGLSAVKTWLYYPGAGAFLMGLSLLLNMIFFPISLIRVTVNRKISAPVGWIQMSAPAVSLYALTIMAQPTFEEEHPDVTTFQKVHRMVYLPCMHFMFFLAVLGAASSVQSFVVRWDNFKNKEFSPAFAAFCFPTLAHANAVQAYRGAIDSFSTIKPRTWGKDLIYCYWLFVLVFGTIVTLIITTKFFYHLPSWVQVDVADEEEPPAPNETMVSYVLGAGETIRQPYVNPVILQANETGVLVRRRGGSGDGRGMFVRTRRVTALGFEPTMNWSEMNEERKNLLDWVAKNPPRRRRHTLSVPGMDFNNYNLEADFGSGNTGVYDFESGTRQAPRARASTTGYDTSRQFRGGRTRGHY